MSDWLPSKFKGTKNYSPSVRKYLTTNGAKKLASFLIMREPVPQHVESMLNLISLGKFKESQAKLGYDHFFHLSLIGTFEGGGSVKIEKNAQISIHACSGNRVQGDAISYLECGSFTPLPLSELLDKARKASGDAAFFEYDAFAYNCQSFVASLLKPLGCYSDTVKSFAYQPVQSLVKEQPSWFTRVSRIITDGKAIAERIVNGEGLSRKHRGIHLNVLRELM